MADSKDTSGQVTLTCAILMAISIVIIALMLNNIIYATNVAYIGFMDGSKYEDQSIRQMTIKEATNSYNYYASDPSARSNYMSTYEKQLNLLTNSKGKYVDLQQTPSSLTPPFTTQTSWKLGINGKSSSVSYVILTGEPGAASPPASTKPTVLFIGAPYTVNEGEGVQVTAALSNEYLDGPVQVIYSTSPGTATSPGDYIDKTDTLSFAPGEKSKTFTITTKNDGAYNPGPAKTFTVTLTPSTNADGSPVSTTVSIVDINPTPTPTVVPETYDMEIVDFTAAEQSDKKNVTLTASVKNTGTQTLHDVKLRVILPTPQTDSLAVITIGNLDPGATSGPYSWTYEMKHQNDKVARVHASSTEVLAAAKDTDIAGKK